jgi:hypothetical protein
MNIFTENMLLLHQSNELMPARTVLINQEISTNFQLKKDYDFLLESQELVRNLNVPQSPGMLDRIFKRLEDEQLIGASASLYK